MSEIDYRDDPADIEIGMIAREIIKLDAFRAAAEEITQEIQSKASQDLCDDLKQISVQQYLVLKLPVAEPVRQKSIAEAQKAINKTIDTAVQGCLKQLESVAKSGLSDFEGDPLYPEGAAWAVHKNITPEFARDVARSGVLTVVNEALSEIMNVVVHDEDENMPISYDGLSTTEQRALYAAFIHASRKAMKITLHMAEPSDDRIHTYFEKLEVVAP